MEERFETKKNASIFEAFLYLLLSLAGARGILGIYLPHVLGINSCARLSLAYSRSYSLRSQIVVVPRSRNQNKMTCGEADHFILAGVAGLEPTTPGFGDQCSTN